MPCSVPLSLVSITTLCLSLVSIAGARDNHAIQDNRSLRRRSNKECPDGFAGSNCKQFVDECKQLPYPCANGTKQGSFCVDHDPPEKFKCGCRAGYDTVFPDAKEVKDPVPIEWRPMKCVPRDVCVVFICHEDATCIVSSSNTAACICNDKLTGDGIIDCSPPPSVSQLSHHHSNREVAPLIPTAVRLKTPFAWTVHANARPVSTKVAERPVPQ
jgi:hypothetical protein